MRLFCSQRPGFCSPFTVLLLLTGIFADRPALAGYSFTPLGNVAAGSFASRPIDVSADGTVVVGYKTSFAGTDAFRWTAESGMVGLGILPGVNFSRANGVSADGAVVVGYNSYSTDSAAFRWTADGGMVELGDLPGGSNTSRANGVSADGKVVVGIGTSSSGQQAFRWTAGGGMIGLGDLPGGGFSSFARDVSADGKVVVGYSESSLGTEAFRWTAGGGMVGLGYLPGSTNYSAATDASADGAVVVGYSGSEGFRWTAENGMVGLGDFSASGISANGRYMAGTSSTNLGNEAFFWSENLGSVRLMDLLVDNGVTNLAGWTLREATAISEDGRTIVGWGVNPLGRNEAFVAVVPEASTLVLGICGAFSLVAATRRRRICE
ncbi:MAG: PEP-CTERM sorting domain-containing protein [Planctomycetota bacterium]